MFCPSKKREYLSKQEAEEALIQHHIQFDFSPGQGPVNVYRCDRCEAWHFTSKGETASILNDPDVKKRIAREKLGSGWNFKN